MRHLAFRQRHLPYCLTRLFDTKWWAMENREYQVLGKDETYDKDARLSHPIDQLIMGGTLIRLPPQSEKRLRGMLPRNDSDNRQNMMFLYHDGCQPEEDWQGYSKRLGYLIKRRSMTPEERDKLIIKHSKEIVEYLEKHKKYFDKHFNVDQYLQYLATQREG